MVLLIIISICLFVSGHWICGFLPLLSMLPYGMLPITLKRLKRVNNEPETVIITSISVLTLWQFVQCSIFGNLSVLGNASPELLKRTFDNLMSQYHEARGDKSMLVYLKLIKQLKDIEIHMELVQFNATILYERYCTSAVGLMSKIYPMYTFSEKTYLHDLEMVSRAMISKKRKYDDLNKQIQAWESKSGTNQTNEQKVMAYEDTLLAISNHEKMSYSDDITVLRYCRLLNRLEKHNEYILSQNRK